MKRGVGKTARIYYIALAISDIGLLVWMCGISIFLVSGGLTFVTGLVSSVLILRLYFNLLAINLALSLPAECLSLSKHCGLAVPLDAEYAVRLPAFKQLAVRFVEHRAPCCRALPTACAGLLQPQEEPDLHNNRGPFLFASHRYWLLSKWG